MTAQGGGGGAARHEANHGSESHLNIVIIGGGVIGVSIAYYLTRHQAYSPSRHHITLLEATSIGGGASGKAGGLLAQWAYPASLVSLSFDLHAELAAKHDGAKAWGFRTIRCGKITAGDRDLDKEQRRASSNGDWLSWARTMIPWAPLGKQRELNKDPQGTARVDLPEDLDWFRADGISKYEDIAPRKETAQVQPYLFTSVMAKLAEKEGVKVIQEAAVEEIESVVEDGAEVVKGVRYIHKPTAQSISMPADIVILAAGPWTPALLPSVPIRALRAHSVTIKPNRPLSAYCLFTDITVPSDEAASPLHTASVHDPASAARDYLSEPELQSGSRPFVRVVSPEIYSRPNNEVYIAGESDERVPLPAGTDEVEIDHAACDLIEQAVANISDELRDGVVTRRRACYLPTVDVPSGNPLIGNTWIDGLLLASGHSCWGIHNAPATGKVISELVFDGKATSADISALDPRMVM
ncbi:unnamed protein product [Clonostachys chloroleuca]|uniref:FAD dependent oxidoreductase domain-containing protein n=1 Tax=Clonostachys chloroleuca TaxID=1926264 RepID=A0AA35PYY2_9HYPO|nr:unnamed protein product [Clonostachys chloroleuca]